MVTAFIISFFPRMLVICFAVALIVQGKEVPVTFAAMRKLHIPEKLTMIFAVIFCFFPVFNKNLKIMSRSIKTR